MLRSKLQFERQGKNRTNIMNIIYFLYDLIDLEQLKPFRYAVGSLSRLHQLNWAYCHQSDDLHESQ